MNQKIWAQNSPPKDGESLFSNLKDLLVRVKAAESVSSPKSSYGTGFVVDASGIIATNYHVISDSVMQPGTQWKIIVETQDAQNLEAELVNLSVVDDLALIRINKKFSGALRFEPKLPAKGERTYSLGLPNDLNMSLIEGVYNGALDYGPYSLVHVTTPLNGGMSGGPTVNRRGLLTGVNVARILFANDISFIVPVERLRKLVHDTHLEGAALGKDEAQEKIYSQLESAQDRLFDSLSKSPKQSVGLWKGKTIQLPDYFKCWADGTDEPQLPYVLKRRNCRVDHAVFLTKSLDTGTLSLEVEMLDSSRINRFSVNQLIGQGVTSRPLFDRFSGETFFGDIDARELFTPYECKQSFVSSRIFGEIKSLRSGICLRKYKKAKNLYDLSLSWFDFQGPLLTRVSVAHDGVSLENSKKLVTYWAELFQ